MANTTLTRDTIHAWPKAELHCHLDGSLRLGTVIDLARAQGKTAILPADSEEQLGEVLREMDESPTLEAFLQWFAYTIPLLQDRDSLARAAYELAEDAARENVRYLEVRYAPILHTEEGLDLDAVNTAVWAGLQDAHRDHGIHCRIIVCGLRDRYESTSLAQAEMAVRHRDRGVVAFDLAGGEAGNPAKQHLQAFYYARNNLLGLTIHAGEAWGPESIHQALFRCGAHRIGHGITLGQDPELLRYVVNHRIPLEVCPTSNVQCHVVDGFAEHPLKGLVEAGVQVTINCDNRLFSRTSLTEELWRVHTRCGIAEPALREIAFNGFRAAFLNWHDREQLLAAARAELMG